MSTSLKVGVIVPSRGPQTREVIRYGQRAADVGVDGLWVGDVIHPGSVDGATVLAALLAATQLPVGANVFNVTFRHPPHLARIVATLELLFPGRLTVGLGVGYHVLDPYIDAYGYPVPERKLRVGLLRETLEYLTLYFTQKTTSYEGRHFRVSGAVGAPFVEGRRPPVLIGGSRPSLMRLAARHAQLWDGMALWSIGAGEGEGHTDFFRRKRAELDGYCREAGRDPAEIRSVQTVYAALAPTQEAARALAEQTAFAVPGGGAAVIGTPEDLTKALLEIESLGVDEVQLIFVDRLLEREQSLGFLGSEVLPALRR